MRLKTPAKRRQRDTRTRNLLLKGVSAADVALDTGMSRKFVHDFANEHELPTNPVVLEGGPLEDQIFAASHVVDWAELQSAFNVAVPMLKKIVARAGKRWKADIKDMAA